MEFAKDLFGKLKITPKPRVIDGAWKKNSPYTSPFSGISVHPKFNDTNLAYGTFNWDHIKRKPNKLFEEERTPNKLRVVLISDTHSNTDDLHVPDADILIHAGDFTKVGKLDEVVEFNDWLGSLPHRYKVVIAGNHELSFGFADKNVGEHRLRRGFGFQGSEAVTAQMEKHGVSHPRELLTNCIYLQDSSVNIAGLKFYGSPWSSWFHGWAYNLRRGEESLKLWDRIPSDTDILITHGPPLGIGDKCNGGILAGCTELYTTVTERVKPKLHVFGHIHEDYGIWNDGVTTFANAANLNKWYQVANEPICMEFDIPAGFTLDDVSEVTLSLDVHSDRGRQNETSQVDVREEKTENQLDVTENNSQTLDLK